MQQPRFIKLSRRTLHTCPQTSVSTSSSRCASSRHAWTRATSNSSPATEARHKTGYLFHELYFWHEPGPWGNLKQYVQPTRHPEHAETKRRLHNLVSVSGLLDQLQVLKPRPAAGSELLRAHTPEYVHAVQAMSADDSKAVHCIGDESHFMPGGYDLAALAAGGAITATESVLDGRVRNAYALCRPPGHHAEPAMGGGYCLFNNVAIAALHALEQHQLERVAIVDFDVHHGNGTQAMFVEDPRVLFISVHQAGNYPLFSGENGDADTSIGRGLGSGTTINVPLPPGSGSGAYRAVFDRVVGPALDMFEPQLVLVSAGFDASYMDPLGQMMLGSEDYRYFTTALQEHAAASSHCQGRIVAVHEGGYSEQYVPFCGLAVIEQLAGLRTKVQDPYWDDVANFAYQELQPHQDACIQAAEQNLEALRQAVLCRARQPGGSSSKLKQQQQQPAASSSSSSSSSSALEVVAAAAGVLGAKDMQADREAGQGALSGC
ncbi:hypothetical protein COO60DRAFT_1268392 [Scenedesmus sp. NREL 46B-D3]|nr:hypothetical protein COO60DRAFT_1268392 [Scenedesmus sp. NREL 46B-D3]